MRRRGIFLATCVVIGLMVGRACHAQPVVPGMDLLADLVGGPEQASVSLQVLFLLTVLSLAPAFLILITCFTRVVVVLSFVRSALALHQMPPNQVIIGLALFITFFVMSPVWTQVYSEAIGPYVAGELPEDVAASLAMEPVREFMLRQTREKDLALFMNFANLPSPVDPEDVPSYVLIPAFGISELKTAFQMGFMIFVPFLVIDMVVASTLMSMGMLMLPPMMVSLPLKVLLFVLTDGWHLVVKSLVVSIR